MALSKEEAIEKLDSMRESASRARKAAAAATAEVIHDAERVGTSFALGIARGRLTDPNKPDKYKVLGAEPDMVLGALGKLAQIAIGGDAGRHVGAVATGALCSFATVSGVDIGVDMRSKALGGGTASSGRLPAPRASLAEELRAVARRRAA